ncbi:hypothetical protein ONZ43_g582 [Nemania bipapillata]|uniref:Uncharacterized protein n=1 Tax=Nemania bipapillata TaxID=110536 RepID=A0ACC2J7M9_9PEZI|nr:hypothetical protein ONZ43_g582 [Nemania bipapillata]
MAPVQFKSQLEASSYLAPGGGQLYSPLREKIVSQALSQGYDQGSMMEHGVVWADDQDPWGHIMNAKFPHCVSASNFRFFESFEEHLKDKFQDLMKVRGIGVIVKSSTLDIKRPVSYPDSIIVANRIDEVKADRYHMTTTMWSLRQQSPVAESNGWVVFYDYSKGKPSSLVQAGGVYANLYASLVEKSKIASQKRVEWAQIHNKNCRSSMSISLSPSPGRVLTEEIDKLFGVCQETFNLPEEVKQAYYHDIPRTFSGFKPRGQTKTEKGEPDRYESFTFSQDGLMGNTTQELPLMLRPHVPLITSYLKHCQDIVAIIASALAKRLGLPKDTFTTLQSPYKPSGTNIRWLKAFASRAEEDLKTALMHHTDFGTMTLLANVVGGLQILTPGRSVTDEAAWLWVRPKPNCLIINMGDAIVKWTGGLLRSNMHRVRHAPGDQRYVDKYSLVYLVRPERMASMRKLVGVSTGGVNGNDQDDSDDDLTAWEWEVKKAMAMVRPEFVSSTKAAIA